MTKEKFHTLTIADISQTYVGKDRCCRCGCGGEYTATSYMINPRSEVNDALVEMRLGRAKRMIESGGFKYEFGDNHVNIVTGKNRALTLYFDEVKK